MKCPNCGTETRAKFCENCGSPLEQNQAQNQNSAQQNAIPTMPVKPKKSIFKKWWFWVIIVVVIGGIAAANGDKDPVKETNDNNSSQSTSTTTPAKETFGIKETAVFKDLKVTANELQESAGSEFNQPADGKVFVGVNFTIENTSDEDQTISSLLLFDAYIDGVKCDYSFSAAMDFSDGTLDGTVSPGKKLVGWYSVEVPKDWKELELQVKSSWLSSSKATFIFNK